MKTSVGGGAVPAAQSGQVILFASLLAFGVVGWEHLFHSYILGVHDESLSGHLLHWLRDSTLALPLALLAVVGGSWLAGRLALRSAVAFGLLRRAVLVSLVFGLLMVPSVGLHDLMDDALVGGESSAALAGSGHSHENGGGLEGAGGVAGLALHGARDALVGEAAMLPLAALGLFLLTLVGGGRLTRERPAAVEGREAAPWAERDGLFGRQVSRREALRLGGAGAAALALGASGLVVWTPSRTHGASGSGSGGVISSPSVEPFSLLLNDRMPPLAVGREIPLDVTLPAADWTRENTLYFELTQKRAEAEIIPGVKTTVWAYHDPLASEHPTTPGPTFRIDKGQRVVVRQINRLEGPDLDLGGVTAVETATHFHGGNTRHDSDGHALDRVKPGSLKDHFYLGTAPEDAPDIPLCDGSMFKLRGRNLQPAGTLWYHDHAMFHTGRNVYMGLAGFFLISDDEEKQLQNDLKLPNQRYEVPLVIQDRLIAPDGSLIYPIPDEDLGHDAKHNVLRQGVFGDVILVNGMPVPRFEVEPRKYRFRLLNGSNARVYQLALRVEGSLEDVPFHVIGTDDGFLCNPSNPDGSLSKMTPVRTTELLMSTSERYDVIIDFSRLAGRRVVLENLRGRELGDPIDEEKTRNVMRFDVVRPMSDVPDTALPTELPCPTYPPPPCVSEAVRTRDWRFERSGGQWVINGVPFPHVEDFKEAEDDRFSSAIVKFGSVEIWRFINKSGGWLHPIHPHLVKYWILSRNGQPPRDYERGPKDSVTLGPNDTIEVIMRFHDWTGHYVMHCHNIEHEDDDMMTQFKVV